ncbi:Histone deacetylase 8-like protein [Drosera capensis]
MSFESESKSEYPATNDAGGGDRIHVFWEEGMLRHESGNGVFDTGIDPGFLAVLEKHPENADRIRNMLSILRRGPIGRFVTWHRGRAATAAELIRFHSSDLCVLEYISELEAADKAGGRIFAAGTFLNPGSWAAALIAAGTTISAMKYILDRHGKTAYALVRPPGHHAQPTQADGYCFLNNAGLAVHLALNDGCDKVAVIDIDVHYGNGTAEGFYGSNKVLTVSLHMNHGSWGSGDKGYEYAVKELVVPSIQGFRPDMMVLVVGQDSIAEGGYHVAYAAYCLHATLEGALSASHPLLSDPIAYHPEDESSIIKAVDAMRRYFMAKMPLLKNLD